jgi:hypothetical protein
VSIEDELLRLARERETKADSALAEMVMEPPNQLLRHLRAYLARQVDHGRIKRTNERILQLAAVQGGLNELACPGVHFSSGARLEFNLQLEDMQRGWLVKRFRFHLRLPRARSINMIRIHLNAEAWHDPLAVPRCHMHIGDSQAHVPFPITDPRLILHLICENVEPNLGI